MGAKDFLRNAVSLLERIDNSPELKSWCRHYSVYAPPQDHALLEAELLSFIDQTYRESLVIVNYRQVIEKWELHDQDIASVSPEWLSVQPYICVLASIAWHFRRDHFQNGALISESIASGALMRIFRRLNDLCSWPSVATTLQTLYCEDCQSIPNDSGVYQILVPSGMSIRFTEQQYNHFAPLYTAEKLADKYAQCTDKEILYIGKAAGRNGLRQRLRQYMKYGWGNGKNHRGGRAIWQVEDAGMLLLTYETCDNASEKERQMIEAYKEKNNCFPVANWRK